MRFIFIVLYVIHFFSIFANDVNIDMWFTNNRTQTIISGTTLAINIASLIAALWLWIKVKVPRIEYNRCFSLGLGVLGIVANIATITSEIIRLSISKEKIVEKWWTLVLRFGAHVGKTIILGVLWWKLYSSTASIDRVNLYMLVALIAFSTAVSTFKLINVIKNKDKL